MDKPIKIMLDDGSLILIHLTNDERGILVFREMGKPLMLRAKDSEEFLIERAD